MTQSLRPPSLFGAVRRTYVSGRGIDAAAARRPRLNERRARVGGTAPRNYPTRAKIRQIVEAARECGLDVFGFEVTRDGTIRVMEARAAPTIVNDFDRWEARL